MSCKAFMGDKVYPDTDWCFFVFLNEDMFCGEWSSDYGCLGNLEIGKICYIASFGCFFDDMSFQGELEV